MNPGAVSNPEPQQKCLNWGRARMSNGSHMAAKNARTSYALLERQDIKIWIDGG